ncbi:hypothetical protein B4123_0816 [Bacillus paralicheniformis]|uniref:Uncharacterized protein n=1 Tax=Bacillus paralicheniformis TaxID=1648923 RepID=A0A7Z0WYZ1_9BACI|nr:hypothetical protein B4121_1222 [Bacillus paralicheniformis]OLG06241.1 hypothetical protein B4123_3847 [Bacillus paralicheniformis]OLG12824.1 hypothetical protein B4123_0816 [Bacillus paralicheniformis]TWJ47605.1 hypothetical protein CHCC5027_4030 [Bacillus paralicheniformis]TWJ77240.1 hypothetical protein CHCC20497_0788 [Bacillus paralicheniformis]
MLKKPSQAFSPLISAPLSLVLIVSKRSYAVLSYKGQLFKNNVILLKSPYHANART